MGTLEVTLIGGVNLTEVERIGKQDPYCILSVNGRSTRSNTHTDGGSEPVWNQVFTWYNVAPEQTLTVEVFDENMVFRDVRIGNSVPLKLKEVTQRGSQDIQLPIFTKKTKKQAGIVVLRLIFRKGSLSPTAVGIVSTSETSPSSPTTLKQQQQLPPRPSTGYRPGQWILPTYQNTQVWEDYTAGRVLGKGAYATTHLAWNKTTNQQVAIKVISKRRLATPDEVADVQREVQIMHHLKGHSNIVELINVYEDYSNVSLVMELCPGGEMFERIVTTGNYSEKDAAAVMRTILSVIGHCHSMGVVHRDLKPENFLYASTAPNAPVKMIDFGLSCFFQEGQTLTEAVGSAMYVAPEVLRRMYGCKADVWSCGVILHILLCGAPPFRGDNANQIFNEVAHKPLDLTGYPWDQISDAAKDCVKLMLTRDVAKRPTAQEMLQHDWMKENGIALDKPLELEVLKRIKTFAGMNKLKKEALKVIASNLPVDEIMGLREMFIDMDINRNGTLTVDEFTAAVRKKGQNISQAEMAAMMEAADMDGDGVIDYEEFLATMVHVSKMQREEHLKAAFEHFDKDKDGLVTKEEVEEALRECQLSRTQIDQIISEVDKDGNGKIDYNEFCVMMRDL